MMAFYYHPTQGAIAHPKNDQFTNSSERMEQQFLCPKCHKSHGKFLLPQQGPVSARYCDACVLGFDIISYEIMLDKFTSLSQNTNTMCKQIRFVTAVALAVSELRKSPSFSPLDITKKLRGQVNDGEIAFSDKEQEVIDGITTYCVKYDEVKEVFRELLHFVVINDIGHRNNPIGYIEYYDSNPQLVASGQVTLSPAPAPAVVIRAPVVSAPLSLNSAKYSVPYLGFINDVKTYLAGRIGQLVTMKEVQSRFKKVKGVTCARYATMLESVGFKLAKSGGSSTWSIQM